METYIQTIKIINCDKEVVTQAPDTVKPLGEIFCVDSSGNQRENLIITSPTDTCAVCLGGGCPHAQ